MKITNFTPAILLSLLAGLVIIPDTFLLDIIQTFLQFDTILSPYISLYESSIRFYCIKIN